MIPCPESLEKLRVEIFEKIPQNDYTYLNDMNVFFQTIINNDVGFCTNNQNCEDIFKNIHLQLMDVVVYKKHPPDFQSLLPQMLYQTLYLSQKSIIEKHSNNLEEHKWILPTKIDDTNKDIHTVHFISLGEKLNLPCEKYDQYCLQIHIGAVKCLQFEKQVKHIINTIDLICDLCFHSEVNLEALKHLTECVSILSKEQWKTVSKYVYKVLMGLMNHHLPTVHDQCILLFKNCLDLENLDYILNIVMTEISWSLRIKFYMLSVIALKYGSKNMLEKYDLSISMWKSLNEPYLLSPCIGLYKIFIKDLSEDDFFTLVMQPIIYYLISHCNISELTRFNFVTYLLPEIKSKHTSSLLILYEEMNSQSKFDLYLRVSVLRKIYNHKIEIKNSDKILDLSLKSGDAKIRSEAFTILCCSKMTPQTLDLIYNFIVDNINSDCATLRIKLISGIENMLSKCKKLSDSICEFLNKLHGFILKNLTPGSNYQRKIASLKIYSVILKFNKNEDYISDFCRNLLFINLLDSEDVRKKSSEILVSYFIIAKEDKTYLNSWMQLGLNLCHDPLFYKNESGSTIVYTVTKLVYKSGYTADIFDFCDSSVSKYILDLAQKQGNRLHANFISNVTNGTLYGLLDTLSNLLFEKASPEANKLNKSEMEKMLTLIKDSLNLMLDTLASRMDAEEKTEAPSFAQMDDALSNLRQSNQNDIHVPTNQFLLNFIWINIKICCDVASKYAVMLATSDIFEKQYQVIQIKRCADMIADVLIRCRHKGAMEATCRSLGVLIKYWKESKNWCQHMLSDHISCMKPENEISRRSAGVRYLIHAIVTNNKNTVKGCIKQLFDVAKENISVSTDTVIELPQARALHLLTAIISNASVSTDSLFSFMEDLILLCIDKLNSSLWTIRNAALQFFSSLQRRIIGQNRLNNDSWLSHLPLEPLLFHFPRLMQQLQLLWSQTNSKLPSQARLIPFMSLLKGVKLQSWTLLPLEHQQFVKNLRCNLWSTGFTIEIFTVRNMAAQAYANTIQCNKISMTLNEVGNEIINHNNGVSPLEFKGSNHLHGLMLLYKYLKDVYFMEFNQEYQVFDINHENLPPLCKSTYISMNRQILGPFSSNMTVGHIQVKHLMIENQISQSSDLLNLINCYMKADRSTTLSFLECFKNFNKCNEKVLIDRFIHFLSTDDKDIFKAIMMNIDALLNRMFEYDIEIQVKENFFSTIFKKCVSCPEKDFIAMLPVLSWLCPSKIRLTLLPFLCKYTDCDLYDSIDRYKSSRSLYYFTDQKDVKLWNTVVELLQDEDTDVRVEVTRFVNRVCFNDSSTLNPYVCLRKMFELETMYMIVNKDLAFICFWNLLSEIKLRSAFDETINPFFNDQSNVYQEQPNILKLAFESLKCLIHSSENLEDYKKVVRGCLTTLKSECEFKRIFVDEDLMILDTYSSVHFLKLYYKREILVLLNFNDHLNMFSSILKPIHVPTKLYI